MLSAILSAVKVQKILSFPLPKARHSFAAAWQGADRHQARSAGNIRPHPSDQIQLDLAKTGGN